jgi:thiol-disulfide isomerase/thioredoxin
MPCLDRRRALAALMAAAANAAAAPAVATPAALIEWPDLEWIGSEQVSRSDLKDVPVVVVFWATCCPFCRRHNAHVDRLYRAVDPRRLRVVSVAVDSDPPDVRRYMEVNGYRFPVATHAGYLRMQFTDRRLIPMTCTVDSDGRAAMCIPGEMAEADVLALASLALPEARRAATRTCVTKPAGQSNRALHPP